jgi:nicotinamide mononucleotide transporter
MRFSKDSLVLAALFLATTIVAISMHRAGGTTWLEVVSFVTGALCVWLTVKANVWNFPISLLNVAAFLFVFFNARLFADAGLQVVYFILTIHGWYLWLWGGKDRSRLSISRVGPAEAGIVAAAGLCLTVGLTIYLRTVNDAAPFLDALTTSLSLCAQYLLNRKYVENWLCWIAADLIYIPLYYHKNLYLTSLLYGVFLCMATMGLLHWLAMYREEEEMAEPKVVTA